jgi:hypothetical protein
MMYQSVSIMNNEVHIVPLGTNSWAVNIGKMSYQAFDSEDKAIEFSQKMASRTDEECPIIFHDREGLTHQLGEDEMTRH